MNSLPQVSREIRDPESHDLLGWIVLEVFPISGRCFSFAVTDKTEIVPIEDVTFDPETGRITGPPEAVRHYRRVNLPWGRTRNGSHEYTGIIHARRAQLGDLRLCPHFVEYQPK